MFLGPFEEGGDYRDEGIQGPYGFLHRLWDTTISAEDCPADPDVERKLHQTIGKVTEQLAGLHYNTSIAALMEYLNSVRAGGRSPARAEVEPLVVMSAPFAPHIAEELWERLGHSTSIFDGANWPAFDPEKARAQELQVAVQINGKLRGTIQGPPGMDQVEAESRARADENVARHLDGATLRRVVFVPDRLLNFVIG
jgi:leucyl-tRNA synthetase